MYVLIRHLLRTLFQSLNLGLVKYKDLIDLQQTFIDHICLTNKYGFYRVFQDNLRGSKISTKPYIEDSNILFESKSQNGQDLFALMSNNFKMGGTFIEFGAYDGVIFSNTHLLEKKYSWNGILIDPIPNHYVKMKINRKCKVINAAVVPKSEHEVIIEATPASDLSKLVTKRNYLRKVHKVKAFTLSEIFEKHLTTNVLDFLSIDIEGKDFEVLKSIDFSKFQINAICIEHNNRKDSDQIIKYMNDKGYLNVYREYSKHDYWFTL